MIKSIYKNSQFIYIKRFLFVLRHRYLSSHFIAEKESMKYLAPLKRSRCCIHDGQKHKGCYCEKELSYGDTLKKPIIPILLEPNFKPTGWLALIVSRFKYVDFSETGSKLA